MSKTCQNWRSFGKVIVMEDFLSDFGRQPASTSKTTVFGARGIGCDNHRLFWGTSLLPSTDFHFAQPADSTENWNRSEATV